jgi:hypothetical protein
MTLSDAQKDFEPGRFPDFTVPSAARMYDYFLGGKNNFRADREAADKVIAAYPETRRLAVANRRFLTRAVWYLAEHGIRQFIDLGSGLPTSPNVHEVARQVRPDARVVYVDSDPMVASHGRALCDTDSGVAFVEHDIRCPDDILGDSRLTGMIDFSAPIAMLSVAVLHFLPDEDNPGQILEAFRSRMAPGSFLVLSHATSDGVDNRVLSEIASAYKESTARAVPRTGADIKGFFTGLDLIEPGLVDVSQWRADMTVKPTKIRFLAGVGRKRPEILPSVQMGNAQGKDADMVAARCSCGFTELADEEMMDHLLRVFETDDQKGTDGLVHEEREPLACACGLSAITVEELDAHLLKAFTPVDAIGHDGKRHEPVGECDGA